MVIKSIKSMVLAFPIVLIFVISVSSENVPPNISTELNDPKPDAHTEDFQTIDEEIEKLKEDVLKLNTELFRLQEDLLFPEDSSVVVFLSVEGGNYFRLDSVKLKLDDKMVTSYLYTEREFTALRKGGVQRLFMGNVKTGEHQFVAVFTGTGPNETDYKRAETFTFVKEYGPTFLKLIIRDDPAKKQPEFTHESWQ